MTEQTRYFNFPNRREPRRTSTKNVDGMFEYETRIDGPEKTKGIERMKEEREGN